MTFKRGDRAVRILTVKSVESASIVTIKSVTGGEAKLKESSWQRYDARTGNSLENPLPGCSTRLVVLEE